ncbi:MAG: PQQ-dependent sugar dehydrogenase [Verrucomicrobia bacterium]|nr:PQQ-dependent sugar dehydrogenase [Verrucomicrobiota bacterium]
MPAMTSLRRLLLPVLAAAVSTTAEAAFPTVYLKPVLLKQIHAPTNIVNANDGSGRIFICDQPGRIHIFQNGQLLPTPFLDITSLAVAQNTGYSERGLLGLAFHPGYANPASPGYRKFYVNYNKNYVAGVDPAPPVADHTPNCTTVIAEFMASATDPNVADLTSERRVLAFSQPQSNHNGGQLEFGPGDGFLYIGTGDGGSSNDNNVGHTGGSALRPTEGLGNGQDRTVYLGKILRIDPLDPDGAGPLTYSIPASNPFFNDATPGTKKEIYAYGLRNPWRFSFDKRAGGTNRLFCGDVGQGRIEEINLIVSGGNYGWRYKEGQELPAFSSGSPTNPMPNPGGTLIDPIATYAHPGVVTNPVLPQLGLSVTGGFVYRGAAIPALQGKYIFGDYGSTAGASDGRIMGLEETAPGSGVFTLTQAVPLYGQANPVVGQRILCLGEDEAGEIYIGMKTNAGVLALDGGLPAGGIYKVVPVESATVQIPASKDNTIFAEDLVFSRFYSDGLGQLYTGYTGNNFGPFVRRALVAFDLSSVPAGATVQSAQLRLNLNKLGPSAAGTNVDLHRLTESWGEGTSLATGPGGSGAPATVGDATWQRRFFDTLSWTTDGGTFSPTVTATVTVNAVGPLTWASTQLTSDVQGWLTTPSSNQGWILRGAEAVENSAVRFDSRQVGTAPTLTISYQSAPAPTHYEAWVATYFPTNLTGQYIDPNGDLDGDGISNLLEYAFGYSPTAYDASNGITTARAAGAGGSTDLSITFRRDSAATDLTYQVQTSSDLSAWTTIATSTAGAAPVGANGGSIVSDAPLTGTMRLVTVGQNLPSGSNARKFVRVLVTRQ